MHTPSKHSRVRHFLCVRYVGWFSARITCGATLGANRPQIDWHYCYHEAYHQKIPPVPLDIMTFAVNGSILHDAANHSDALQQHLVTITEAHWHPVIIIKLSHVNVVVASVNNVETRRKSRRQQVTTDLS
ncbi:hypothetical protein BIW11_09626 [Tropilaelaps mercedesae]|uniref:Uncharacterized protein n=1 Tax=Tropilaelaps mercedesae TaxID=418985 RepID=A0A1V9XJJ3_9ACAR|nr:hypothetical protein BIW11_09626 [Tropilaelaps mercedesae]